MRKMALRLIGMVLVAAGGSLAVAHHAFFSEYDRAHPVKLTGVVIAVDWLNPASSCASSYSTLTRILAC